MGYGIHDRIEGGRIYAVDTWKGTPTEDSHKELLEGYKENQLYEEFMQNMGDNSLENIVVPIVGDTIEVARQWPLELGIGLLHIDASHDYEAVRRDFEFRSPHIINNGIVVFDDVQEWQGPARIITELPRWYRHFGVATNKMIFIKN